MSLPIFFQNACTSNSLEVDQRIKAEFEHRFQSYAHKPSLGKSYSTNVDTVDKIITELKNGKAAGVDEIVAEHLKYCHPIICVILVKFSICS